MSDELKPFVVVYSLDPTLVSETKTLMVLDEDDARGAFLKYAEEEGLLAAHPNLEIVSISPTDETTVTVNSNWTYTGNITATTIVPIRSESKLPLTFRIARYPNSETKIQGGYQFWEGFNSGIVWRDLPTVDVDESGTELSHDEA